MPLIHNIISCSGFQETAGGWVASGPCIKARLGIVLLFFVIAMVRKWGGEELGLEFNFLISCVIGILAYILIVTFTGNFGWAFMIGLVSALIGGYGSGLFLGSDGGDY